MGSNCQYPFLNSGAQNWTLYSRWASESFNSKVGGPWDSSRKQSRSHKPEVCSSLPGGGGTNSPLTDVSLYTPHPQQQPYSPLSMQSSLKLFKEPLKLRRSKRILNSNEPMNGTNNLPKSHYETNTWGNYSTSHSTINILIREVRGRANPPNKTALMEITDDFERGSTSEA